MGRFGADVDGMGTEQSVARAGGVMAAIRRPLRSVSGQPRRSGIQSDVGRTIPDLGWRIPFALSLLLVGVGLYIRLGIMETPVFAKLLAERKVERTPMLTVIKRHPKEILLSALARMAEQAPFYIFTAVIFSYGIDTLHVSRNFLLTAVLSASVLSFISI